MIRNEFYTAQVQGAYQLYDAGDFALEEGGMIPDLRLAYATYGTLSAAKDNAILVPTWFSGTHQTFELAYIEPGRALDPQRYFIVVINQIGNGLSTSPHNAEGDTAMSRFPKVRIGDDVRAQEQLLREVFGIESLALVVGGSMGAQQTYEWAVRFPAKVLRAAPIAGTAQNTPHDFLFTQTLMDAITSDPGWQAGEYSSHTDVAAGLRRHARIWAVVGFSTEFWKTEAWRTIEVDGVTFTSLDEYLAFREALYCEMDPNALLSMAWKWQRGDVTRHTGGDLAAALGRITAKTFVMPIDEDMFFPPRDCDAEQALVLNSELRVVEDVLGHLGLFGIAPTYMPQIDHHLADLLATEV